MTDDDFTIHLKLDENKKGRFIIGNETNVAGWMDVEQRDNILVVFHTEVSEDYRKLNLGKRLLDHMVEYARQNNLKVLAYCPYVRLQFKRYQTMYADVIGRPVE